MDIMDTMEIPDITHSTVFTMTLGMEGETGMEKRDLASGALTLRRRRTTPAQGTRAEVPAWSDTSGSSLQMSRQILKAGLWTGMSTTATSEALSVFHQLHSSRD